MNLRWYDKILVALSGLVLAALGVCVILAAGGVISLPEGIAFDAWLGDGWQWMPLVFVAGILIIAWGLWLVIRPFRRGEGGGKYYMLKDEAGGNVRISVGAIDHLVRKCIDAYGQVASAKVRIGGREDAMDITLHMTVDSEVRIPMLVEELREDIKQSLDRSAGIQVKNVNIYVDATRDDKHAGGSVKYLEEKGRTVPQAPVEEPLGHPVADVADDDAGTASFYTPPVVLTGEAKPADAEPLKERIVFGPGDSLPVEISPDAFPFPEADGSVKADTAGENHTEEDPDA